MRNSDRLCAEVMENAKLSKCCDEIEKVVMDKLKESPNDKLLLEIQRLLRLRH